MEGEITFLIYNQKETAPSHQSVGIQTESMVGQMNHNQKRKSSRNESQDFVKKNQEGDDFNINKPSKSKKMKETKEKEKTSESKANEKPEIIQKKKVHEGKKTHVCSHSDCKVLCQSFSGLFNTPN